MVRAQSDELFLPRALFACNNYQLNLQVKGEGVVLPSLEATISSYGGGQYVVYRRPKTMMLHRPEGLVQI